MWCFVIISGNFSREVCLNTDYSSHDEVPGSSPTKHRGPQTRDHVAAWLTSQGAGLGSGRSYERCKRVIERADQLRAAGYVQAGDLLAAALEVSKRGAYEIARLPEELLLALCEVVSAGEARDLIKARRLVIALAREKHGADQEPVTLERAKNGMYRIRSLRNHSSILVSPQDLLHLAQGETPAQMGAKTLGLSPAVEGRGRRQAQIATFLPNADQAKAIALGVESELLLVIGPPGTGKTATESALVLEHLLAGKTVLLAAYTNKTLDTAMKRIHE